MTAWLLASVLLLAQPGVTDPEQTWSFAGDLASREDYYRAITEYRRFAWLAPEDPRAVKALETAGWLALEAEQYGEAESLFAAAARRAREQKRVASDETPPEILFGRAAVWDAQGYDADAAAEYRGVAEQAEGELAAEATWRAAWSELEARMKLASTEGGARRVSDVLPDALTDLADDPARATSVREMVAEAQRDRFGYRRPLIAMILNLVVPGSGFLYAGKPGPAVASFVLNAAFVGAIAWSIQQKNYPLAAAALGLEVGWYFGGAQGAASAVMDRNQRIFETTRDHYRKSYFQGGFRP